MELYTGIPAGLQVYIPGQFYTWHYSLVYWKMLKFGFRIKSAREVLGQIPRLLVGGVKSFVGKISVGNKLNVHPLQHMEPKGLKFILNRY